MTPGLIRQKTLVTYSTHLRQVYSVAILPRTVCSALVLTRIVITSMTALHLLSGLVFQLQEQLYLAVLASALSAGCADDEYYIETKKRLIDYQHRAFIDLLGGRCSFIKGRSSPVSNAVPPKRDIINYVIFIFIILF